MTTDKNPTIIKEMFNKISLKYDQINNIMSFGTHKYIKYDCVKNLEIKPHDNILDLCCGTGDITGIIKKIYPNCCIIGVDFSENMIKIAESKNKNIRFFQGDATNLPYGDNSFDIVTMSFGLRNIQNAEKAIEEIYRILKPNGQFLHLDFGEKNFLSKIYDKLTPFLVRFFTNNTLPYSYLIQSKQEFLTPKDLIKDFENKGFRFHKRKDYLFGVISSQIMKK